jgi:hypothetical protein
MTQTVKFSTDEATPNRASVLDHQGIPATAALRPAVDELLKLALALLAETAAPVGIVRDLTAAEFEVVYYGEGRNEPRTPVGEIMGRAQRLALFAVTLGPRVSQEIARRFNGHEAAIGALLDSAASAAADQLAEHAERRFRATLARDGAATAAVLRYSPGYCGWHISGQKKLFELLRPDQIGITLRESFLMEPLKSVSGVILAGPADMHDFPMSYPFCRECRARSCRERIRALQAASRT